jgi:N-acetylmuramoyl-L-alanine amidase
LLECATLTSERDRARLANPNVIANLAIAITDGLEAYERNE